MQPLPSTVSDNPAGEVVTVVPTLEAPKLAVTEAGALSVRFCGVVVPLRAPLNPANWLPRLAVALTATTVPLLYHALPGAMVPPEPAEVVSKYWVLKLAVYVVAEAGTVMECGCAPESDQLAYTYWVPAGPACVVEVTPIVWFDPAVH